MLVIDDIVEQVREEFGWSVNAAQRYQRDYVAFLSNAGTPRRPTAAVDAIWHAHILWTRRYRRDCEILVGHFIDHEPDSARSVGKCTSPADIEAGFAPPSKPGRRQLANCTPSDPAPPIPVRRQSTVRRDPSPSLEMVPSFPTARTIRS